MNQSILFETEAPTLPGYPCAFSRDRAYRYVLWRVWANLAAPRYCAFVGLNPSTADEATDDPTIRRCIGFAKDWGYDALAMLNLFAFRATDPRDMKAADDPVGDDNDYWIAQCADHCELIVCGWGEHGAHQRRGEAVRVLLSGKAVQCLALNKSGMPKHPLYVAASVQPTEWRRERQIEPATNNHGDNDG